MPSHSTLVKSPLDSVLAPWSIENLNICDENACDSVSSGDKEELDLYVVIAL